MKKYFVIIIAFVFCITALTSSAQLANGSIAPDFNFTDIAGNSQHLYTYLDSGRTVFINVSAAWSSSSWNYHHTKYMDSLYNQHGVGVARNLKVLFIEGELTNDSIQLYGVSTNSTPSGFSTGNFTLNVPYPIIDLKTSTPGATNFMGVSGYNIHSFPTIMMICPDRRVTIVGQETTAGLYASRANCDTASVATDAELFTPTTANNALASCDSVTPTFRIANIGTAPLTQANITIKVDGVVQTNFVWNGPLSTYQSAVIPGHKVTAAIGGRHVVTAYVTNPNGVADPTIANDSAITSFVQYPSVGGAVINQDFETNGMPSDWVINNGGDTYTWENTTDGYSSSAATRLRCYYIPTGDVDMFTLYPMSFVGLSSPGLTFDLAYATFQVTDMDRLEVQSSTDCGLTWTTHYYKTGDSLATHAPVMSEFAPTSPYHWRKELVLLHNCADSANVLVRFKATSGYGNDIFIDNINVTESANVMEVSTNVKFNVYPNPASTNATINYQLAQNSKLYINVTTIYGEEVKTLELGNKMAGNHYEQINTEALANGVYFIAIHTDEGTTCKKLVINR